MRIVLVADSFPPIKNSAAVLVFYLAEALAGLGHQVLVVTPSSEIEKSHLIDDFGVFQVLRIRCGKIKSHQQWMRGINEFRLFFRLPREFKKTSYAFNQWDLLIWYSPSIFLGGMVRVLKRRSKISYLILRDIVPDWMIDTGLMKKGPSYLFLKWFEKYQYRFADVIGVQSSGNKHYIEKLNLPNLKELEVLPNWMPSASLYYHPSSDNFLHADLQHTVLAGRKVLVYAGNIGEAQGIKNFAQLMFSCKNHSDIGFLIIGRGSKREWLRDYLKTNQILNALILDEVDLITLTAYYRQCCAGLVFLDPKHQSHNIPGKFISYLEAGLPVAACVNSNNDLVNIIKLNKLGIVTNNINEFSSQLEDLIGGIQLGEAYKKRARDFYESNYQPNMIAHQLIGAFSRGSGKF